MRSVERLVGHAAAGACGGVLCALAVLPGEPASAGVFGTWLAGGAVASLLCASLGHGSQLLSRLLRRAYAPGSGDGRCAWLLATGLCAGLLAPAVVEVAERPGLARFGPPLLIGGSLTALALCASGVLAATVLNRSGSPGSALGAALVLLGLGIVATADRLPLAFLPTSRLTGALLGAAGVALGLHGLVVTRAGSRAAKTAGVLLVLAAVAGAAIAAGLQPVSERPALTAALGDLLPGPAAGRETRRVDVSPWFGRGHAGLGDELDRLAPERRGFDVLWITTCTLRFDRLAAGGCRRGLTPAMDALARDGFLFERAYSTFPATAYSVTSMFTGRYPSHTARYARKVGRKAPDDETWLPSLLRKQGLTTWGLTALDETLLRTQCTGILDGFDVANPYPHLVTAPGALIADTWAGLLARRPADRRLFAWIMLMEPHGPYEGDAEGPPLGDAPGDRYDGDVRRADRAIGRILQILERSGRARRTLVILHGDHGEEFLEHGGRDHFSSVYDEQVHVPLIVKVPGLRPGTTRVPVDLTDLLPTLTEILDLPERRTSGDSLVPLLLGRPMESFACAELVLPDRPRDASRMVVSPERWKLVQHARGGREELFDLDADPRERRDLASGEPARLLNLRSILSAVLDRGLPRTRSWPDLPRGSWTALRGSRFRSTDLMADFLRGPARDVALLKKTLALVGLLGRADLAELALRFAGHADAEVRESVLGLAGRFRPPAARMAVLTRLMDPMWSVRRAALRIWPRVARPGDAARVPRTPDAGVEEQLERALCLARLGETGPLLDLQPRISGWPLPLVARWVAGRLLIGADPAALGLARGLALANGVPREARMVAIEALRVARRPACAAAALGMLERGELREEGPLLALLLALDRKQPWTWPLLLEAAAVTSPATRRQALALLGRVHGRETARQLLRDWQRLRGCAAARDSSLASVRTRALGALAAAGVPVAEKLRGPAEGIATLRCAIIAQLGIGPPGALPQTLLVHLRHDQARAVRVAVSLRYQTSDNPVESASWHVLAIPSGNGITAPLPLKACPGSVPVAVSISHAGPSGTLLRQGARLPPR